MNNSRDRYLTHLNIFNKNIEKSLKDHFKNNLISPGQALHSNDGRTPFFQLQGLARIDSKIGKDISKAERLLLDFKEIEDALGKYDYWVSMLDNNKKWKFPVVIENYFTNQSYYQLGILEDRLLNEGWLIKENNEFKYSEHAFERIKKSIKKVDFYGTEKEQKKLLQFFRDEVIEIHDKVKSNQIDLGDLEMGVHEFRRKIRWIGIYCSALMGKVRIEQGKKDEPLFQFVTKERSSLKFNQLPFNKNQEDPLYFLQGGYYAISDLIKGIGDIKDPGLATKEMLQVGKLFGLNDSVIKKHLGKDYYPYNKVVKDSKDLVHKFLFNENILLLVAQHFDQQIN
ncbi:MAG: hypothetical protein WCJ33_10300 [Pseudomonadota bacterium]